MAAPFTITAVSNYNSNPPPDDGSQVPANRVQWSTQKTKLADPVYNAFNTSESATSAAFGKVVGGAGITSTGVSYTVASSDQSKLIKATGSGITITTPDATVVGSPFVFMVLNNSSGDIILDGNGSQTVDGSLTINIPTNCGVMVETDGSNWFTAGQNFNNVLAMPQGYLSLSNSADPILTGDVISGTSVYYTPYQGDRIPISIDGATFKMRQFSQLTLALSTNHLSNGIYDVFLFDNGGVTTIGTGPEWNTVSAGAGARGTGAGTTQLSSLHGIWTNAVSMTARNGSTTYTVAANQGTYVGSIFIDGTAGQITCHVTYGQSRKWGVWNAYWRRPLILQAGDSTSSWTYGTNAIRPSRNATGNSITTFVGLPEEEILVRFNQFIQGSTSGASASTTWQTGIGWNSTTAFSGTVSNGGVASGSGSNSITVNMTGPASYLNPPGIGINVATSLEITLTASAVPIYSGTVGNMFLSASYRA